MCFMRGLALLVIAIAGLVAVAWFNQDSWVAIACIVGIVWLLLTAARRGLELVGGPATAVDDPSGRLAAQNHDEARKRHGRDHPP